MDPKQYRVAGIWLAFAAIAAIFDVPPWALFAASLCAFGCAKIKSWGPDGTG